MQSGTNTDISLYLPGQVHGLNAEVFAKNYDANVATIARLFGTTRSRAWRRVTADLAIATPPVVFQIMERAEIKTGLQTVLAMPGAMSAPVIAAQAGAWAAVNGLIGWVLDIPPLFITSLQVVSTSAVFFMQEYDPLLKLVGWATGVKSYASNAGEVDPQERSLIVNVPLLDKFDVKAMTVLHEILHVEEAELALQHPVIRDLVLPLHMPLHERRRHTLRAVKRHRHPSSRRGKRCVRRSTTSRLCPAGSRSNWCRRSSPKRRRASRLSTSSSTKTARSLKRTRCSANRVIRSLHTTGLHLQASSGSSPSKH